MQNYFGARLNVFILHPFSTNRRLFSLLALRKQLYLVVFSNKVKKHHNMVLELSIKKTKLTINAYIGLLVYSTQFHNMQLLIAR